MRLRAVVRTVTGKTRHLQGARVDDQLEVTAIPNPKTVEVVEDDGSVFLLRLDSEGVCIADTWHESVEAAKAQAEFEYGIAEKDWEDMDSGQ